MLLLLVRNCDAAQPKQPTKTGQGDRAQKRNNWKIMCKIISVPFGGGRYSRFRGFEDSKIPWVENRAKNDENFSNFSKCENIKYENYENAQNAAE